MSAVTSATHDYSEDALVERPAIALFGELGWATRNCFHERFGPNGTLGRETSAEVVLRPRLRAALGRLNPGLSSEAVGLALEELCRDRSAMSQVTANRELYRLLKDGVRVRFIGADGAPALETVRVIDWEQPRNNDFFLASQFWVSGEMHKRRPDLVGFVNGLPLVFVELKASHRRLENAYRDNLSDYKDTIPQLFWYNALIILSNGSQSRVGSVTAAWEHFAEWKKINSEGEEGIVSLETVIRGTCEPSRLLDLVENFTLFSEAAGGPVKLLAKNHQYLGVNNAVEALRRLEENRGRLGVFWHTQGSGKSYSMVFFSQKVLRKLPGNYTFLIVTDRQELDDQIYKTFADAGAVTEGQQVQAQSGEHLKQLLGEDHRNIFTLIQKFHAPKGHRYPEISIRDDIIVITDEAHRSQYDTLALNMRNALPNAAFIGFTGTPLMAGEERTREVFGDYVSTYNFKQSVDDGATVPLHYENRIPELQLTNNDLDADLERLVEEADLDEAQEKRLEREFARQYHLITRDDRLEKIAADIVAHFMGRGQAGKAMVVSIDKLTAVRMHDKVRKHWRLYLDDLRSQLGTAGSAERAEIDEKVRFMEETDMAVVISPSQNEVRDFREKGLDILPHRRRMIQEDLETRFKKADDAFRIVFVTAMWMTGFDVPSLSTLYLDKPMRNHTLMQAIARANRVFEGKLNGLIVDYVGVFRNLQKALAIYGSASGGGVTEGEMPVKDKSELLSALSEAVGEAGAWCASHGINLPGIDAAPNWDKIRLIDDAVENILENDDTKRQFLALAARVSILYKAVLPDPAATEYAPVRALLEVLATKILDLGPQPDISGVMEQVAELLDRSVAAEAYVIKEEPGAYDPDGMVDLSRIDFEALRMRFQYGRKHTEAEKLKAAISARLLQMVRLNRTRADYLERFRQLIEEYNADSKNLQEFFEELVRFTQELNEEEQRTLAEGLSEEELAVFDLLTRPAPDLSEKEKT